MQCRKLCFTHKGQRTKINYRVSIAQYIGFVKFANLYIVFLRWFAEKQEKRSYLLLNGQAVKSVRSCTLTIEYPSAGSYTGSADSVHSAALVDA